MFTSKEELDISFQLLKLFSTYLQKVFRERDEKDGMKRSLRISKALDVVSDELYQESIERGYIK